MTDPHTAAAVWARDFLHDPSGTFHSTIRSVLRVLGPYLVPCAVVLGVLLLGAGVGCWIGEQVWQRRQAAGARLITIAVPVTVDPAGAEAFWSTMTGLLRPAWERRCGRQPHVVWEWILTDATARPRVWVPASIPPGLVEQALTAAYPGALCTTTPARAPFPDTSGVTAAGELRLARPEALPIRTSFAADPARPLFTDHGRELGERVCVQVLARPVAGRRVRKMRRAGHHLTHPRPSVVGRLLDLLTPHTTPRRDGREGRGQNRQASLERSAQDRAIVAKSRGALFETRIRYGIHIPAQDTGTGARRRAAGQAHTLAAAYAPFADHNSYRRHRLHHPIQQLTDRRLRRGDLLSPQEVAAIAHLPTDPQVPGVARAGAKTLPAPPTIPRPGPAIKTLGIASSGRPVGLAVADARHHLHIQGATGAGKSTALVQLILQDVAAGRGVVCLDPKGDQITDLLDRLPADVADRLQLLDPNSPGSPPCLNPLDGPDASVAVDNTVSIFRRVYAGSWGPRTDDVMRAACLTLCANPESTPTLAHIPDLLTNPQSRTLALQHVTDPVLAGFWAHYGTLSDAAAGQIIAPLMNKLRGFLLRPFVRDAIAAGPSSVSMARILDGGILLARLPKGALGDDTARLVGSLLLAGVWQAATARASQPVKARRDAGVYIDECHNFLNLPIPIEDMLAEARGYRLALTLAHQNSAQLPRELKEGLAANARNKLYFTVSPEDATDLARHVHPRLTDHDLAHLPAYTAAARLLVHGTPTDAFTLRTRPLPPVMPGRARALRRATARARSLKAAQTSPRPPRRPDPRTH